ncbi:Zn-dependent hydrolase [Virgibacillus dokdonensis]|uniref:Zn-dependent hydrolase n=2 Tax=Virgibacillus TaxID=84406 RepID=A0ABU7VJY9_9BACI
MAKLTIESKEFQQVLANLRFENMFLSPELQKKVVSLVNNDKRITQETIKRIIANG